MIPSTTTRKKDWIGEIMKKARALKMIRDERKKKGLSSWKVAEKADIAQSTWVRAESQSRDTSWDVILKMAEAVGLETSISIRVND